MKTRLLVVLSVVVLCSHLDQASRVEGREQTPFPAQPLLFESLPPLGAPVVSDALRGLPRARGNPTSTVMISGLGQICELNEAVQPVNPIFPFGSSFRGPLDFAIGPLDDNMRAGLLIAGSLDPSDRPIVLFSLAPPPARLGETTVPDGATGGLRTVMADFVADKTPEFIFSSGPGGPGRVHLVEVNRDAVITFDPFGPNFSGGIFVAAGDVNGDGFADLLTAQERGGEVKLFDFVGGEAREIGRGRPFGEGYDGGVRVAAGDVNNDGKAEIVAATISGTPHLRIFDVKSPARVLGDFRPFEQPRPGGVSVATGLSNGEPFVIAASGPNVRKFEVNSEGAWVRTILEDNPFQQITDILLGVRTFTPPPQ